MKKRREMQPKVLPFSAGMRVKRALMPEKARVLSLVAWPPFCSGCAELYKIEAMTRRKARRQPAGAPKRRAAACRKSASPLPVIQGSAGAFFGIKQAYFRPGARNRIGLPRLYGAEKQPCGACAKPQAPLP